MSIAGPSTLRCLPRIATNLPKRHFRNRLTSSFHSSPTYLNSVSKRSAHALAQPGTTPSGFEGVPAPAYVLEGGTSPTPTVGIDKGKRRMDIKSKKNAITMTPAALDRLRALLSSDSNPKLLRIGVKSRGCAGMAYHLDYVSPPGGKFDEVVEQDGVKVLIDSKALFSIIGSRMDWRDNRLSAGFVFENPNVVDTCGCGESFNIKF